MHVQSSSPPRHGEERPENQAPELTRDRWLVLELETRLRAATVSSPCALGRTCRAPEGLPGHCGVRAAFP